MANMNVNCPRCRHKFQIDEEWAGLGIRCPNCENDFIAPKKRKKNGKTKFDITCPHCGQELEVEEEWVGMEVPCPYCKQDFVIPQRQQQFKRSSQSRAKNDFVQPKQRVSKQKREKVSGNQAEIPPFVIGLIMTAPPLILALVTGWYLAVLCICVPLEIIFLISRHGRRYRYEGFLCIFMVFFLLFAAILDEKNTKSNPASQNVSQSQTTADVNKTSSKSSSTEQRIKGLKEYHKILKQLERLNQ